MSDEFLLSIIRDEFKVQNELLRDLTGSIFKIIFYLCAIALLFAIIVPQHDFKPSKWLQLQSDFEIWTNNLSDDVKKSSYVQVINAYILEPSRRKITNSITSSGHESEVPPSADMMDVAAQLSDIVYGINFQTIGDLKRSLSLMLEQQNVHVLKDLAKVHYQGGPLTQGTSLRDSFFNDSIVEHKALYNQFPFQAERPISEYVSAVQEKIKNIEKAYPDAAAAWYAYSDSRKRYAMQGWTWAAWRDLDDHTITEWRKIEKEAGKEFDIATVGQMSDKFRPDTISIARIIAVLSSSIDNEVAKEAKESKSTTKFWDIELIIPIPAMMLAFPIIFSAGNIVLMANLLRQSMASKNISSIAKRLDSSKQTDVLQDYYQENHRACFYIRRRLTSKRSFVVKFHIKFIPMIMYLILYWAIGIYVNSYSVWVTWTVGIGSIGPLNPIVFLTVLSSSISAVSFTCYKFMKTL